MGLNPNPAPMRRLLPALLIFLAIGPLPGTVQRFPSTNLIESIEVRPLSFAPMARGALRFERGWHLTSPHSHFGGFSALARVAPGRFLLIGDNGYATQLALNGSGGTASMTIRRLPSPNGQPQRKSLIDVEALAVDRASGGVWIALEAVNEVWRLDPGLTSVESRRALPKPHWPSNRGPEAMVRLADGRTLIFSEDARRDSRGRAALLYTGDPAAPGRPPLRFLYDSERRGLVSDAAVLPDGRILLVHRRLGFAPAFTTYLTILDPDEITPNGVVRSRPIGRVPLTLAENYEGAAVSVEQGRTWLWLVADNNFNRWQRSLLLQIELRDLPPKQAADSKKAAG